MPEERAQRRLAAILAGDAPFRQDGIGRQDGMTDGLLDLIDLRARAAELRRPGSQSRDESGGGRTTRPRRDSDSC